MADVLTRQQVMISQKSKVLKAPLRMDIGPLVPLSEPGKLTSQMTTD
jgi:hypothetical protein